MTDEALIYQRIGEFVVSFQWLENKLREIGWFILDPNHKCWPPRELRKLTNEKLIDKVHRLFLEALPKCKLEKEQENDFRTSFLECVAVLHQLRDDRNRILHSAFIELKAGGEVVGLMRSDSRIKKDEGTGCNYCDQEILKPKTFDNRMREMEEAAIFLNQAYLQLISRYPLDGT